MIICRSSDGKDRKFVGILTRSVWLRHHEDIISYLFSTCFSVKGDQWSQKDVIKSDTMVVYVA